MPTRFNKSLDKRYVKLTGAAAADIYCIGARHTDGLSVIPETRLEFFTTKTDFDPQSILGKDITLTTDGQFKVSGIVISVEELGFADTDVLYAAEIRPKHWLTTISAQNRVFQGKPAVEIVRDVLAALEIDAIRSEVSGTYPAREYCVQYDETNFAFINRLMEQEGIYYYFDCSGNAPTMVLCDNINAHRHAGTISFIKASTSTGAMDTESIQTWTANGRAVAGKVSLWDYDPLKSKTKLESTSSASVAAANKKVETYLASGRYTTTDVGDSIARRDVEGRVAQTKRFTGTTNHPMLTTGCTFDFDHADLASAKGAYLAVATTHYMLCDADTTDPELGNKYHPHVERIDYPEAMVFFQSIFEVQPKSVPFRAPRMTPWPAVPGFLTAIVTGPDGEEIHTDAHGRIKIKFPWDRERATNDTTSCWVRVVTPWGGKGWGWMGIPRVGMEVIIQFERGNIDRPYCTGMVYNDINKVPYPLPDQMTKVGLRTNTSKHGGGFHELTFDDKKDYESVFFQSEKDYKQVIKNNAEITIGLEKKDKGSLTQTIQQDKTETIKEGDVSLTVEKGNRITKVKTDDTTTIEGKSTTEITGNTKLTVKDGHLEETVSTGNVSLTVDKGNQTTKVSMGNISVEAVAGKITISAAQSIELKVGASSVKIEPASVTITSTMITVDGKAMTEVKAPLIGVKGTALVEVAAPLIKIG
jgi:type VI secretion system secreted protein VgrG